MAITPPVDPNRAATIRQFFAQRNASARTRFDPLEDLLNRQAARRTDRRALTQAIRANQTQRLTQALSDAPLALPAAGQTATGGQALAQYVNPGTSRAVVPATGTQAALAGGRALPAASTPLAIGPGTAAAAPATIPMGGAGVGGTAAAARTAATAGRGMTGAQALAGLGVTYPGPTGGAGGATGASRFAPQLSRAGVLRGLGYGGAGLAAGQLAGNLFDDEGTYADEGLSGALAGAGIGAGIGSVVPLIGTGIGAGVGALAGGAIGLFGPKSTGTKAVASEIENQSQDFNEILTTYNLSPEARNQLQVQLDVMLAQAGSKDDVKAAYAQVGQLVPGLVASDQARQADAARAAAIYAMLSPQMEQLNQQSSQAARELSTAMSSAAGNISDPQLADIYRARAAEVPYTATRNNQSAMLELALADAAYKAQAQQQAAAAQQSSVDPTLAALLAGG